MDDAGESFIGRDGKTRVDTVPMGGLYATFFGSEAKTSMTIFAFVLVLGVALGLALPPDSYPEPYGWISSFTGWVYFSA